MKSHCQIRDQERRERCEVPLSWRGKAGVKSLSQLRNMERRDRWEAPFLAKKLLAPDSC